MSTVFEKIIAGEFPGRFVWSDDICVAFATIQPIATGHVLVVPRQPWAKWTQCPPAVLAHLVDVARTIGLAQERAFAVPRTGMMVAGFEVPHTHVHVIPMRSEADIAFANAHRATDAELDDAMGRLRSALVEGGYSTTVPPDVHSPELA